jgi:hypothetical protein
MDGGDDGIGRDPSAGEDILEQGSDRPPLRLWPKVRFGRPPRIAVILGVAGLVIGLAGGYAAGYLHEAKRTSPPAQLAGPASSGAVIWAGVGGFPLGQSGTPCFDQNGTQLQLGMQITNFSSAPATLDSVKVILPLGGLKVISQSWGACGELPGSFGSPGTALPAAATTWFTVTFQVLVKCPQPLPVQFALGYTQNGRPATVHLPGFDDLGQITYAGCS